MRLEIQDGRAVSFWFDNWLGLGKLIDITGDLGLRYMGVVRSETVADASCSARWKIRSTGSRRYPQVHEKIAGTDPPNRILWRHGQDNFKPVFSAAQTWEFLREENPKIPLHKLVWFPQAVPHQDFIVWLAIKDRLATGVSSGGSRPAI